MKNNFIKYLFIVVVVLLIVFAVFKINKDNGKNYQFVIYNFFQMYYKYICRKYKYILIIGGKNGNFKNFIKI